MRMICLFILMLLVGAIGIFIVQNPEPIRLQYLGQSIECPPALLIAAVFLLGMVGGWTVVGFVQRSLRRVTERPSQ